MVYVGVRVFEVEVDEIYVEVNCGWTRISLKKRLKFLGVNHYFAWNARQRSFSKVYTYFKY